MKESATLAYQNHPVKFTVYIFDIDVTHDIENYGNIETSLDYPQITEYRIGEANFTLRDYDEEGNVGQKYNPEYEGNFFGQYGLQSGYKSPVRIEVHFLVDGELKSSINPTSSDTEKLPIILFEGKILSVNKGLRAGTVEITCSDLTQEFRTKNTDNFGVPKQIALAKGESSQREGDYPIPYLLTPVSEESLIAVSPNQLKEVERLETIGVLDKYKYVATDTSIQLEDGYLTETVRLDEEDEDGVKKTTQKDVDPVTFFKAPYRNKRIEDLVKEIAAHYKIGNTNIEVPQPNLDYNFFTNLGRVGYDFDKKDTHEKWRWEGFVTDFIYGENLAAFNKEPFNHNRLTDDNLKNARGLADGENHFYTIQSSSPNYLGKGSYLYSINVITGRTTEVFEFEYDTPVDDYRPLDDGLIFYDNKLLILAEKGGATYLFSVDPFHLNSLDRVAVTPIIIEEHPNGIRPDQGEGGLSRSLVYHDDHLYLVKQNGLDRVNLENGRATLTEIGQFTEDWANSPRIICAASYDGNLYGIGKEFESSIFNLYRINHYIGKATQIKIDLPDQYDPKALNTYRGVLYTLRDESTIDLVTIERNPYKFESQEIYENSKGDKLFFLYSSREPKTYPKIIEYDIESDTYTELYSHVSSQNTLNELPTHAEFWKITSVDYKTFYILGTEPLLGSSNDYLGSYNSSNANWSSPGRVKIWKFDRVTLEFTIYIEHNTSPDSTKTTLPLGKAPPQLGHYYHKSQRYPTLPDSRKNFQAIKLAQHTGLFYIWADGTRFGVASATGDPPNPVIEHIFIANTDKHYNSCGCDFVIDQSNDLIYGAFTFVNTKHNYSTFTVYKESLSF